MSASAPTAASAAAPTWRDGGTNILVLDGHEGNLRLIHAWLEEARIQHAQVSDGQNAFALANGTKYSLIFVDVDTVWDSGPTDGFLTASAIRSQSGVNATTPLVAMSCKASTIQQQCGQTGFSHIISKPLNRNEIFTAIEAWNKQEIIKPKVTDPVDLPDLQLDLDNFTPEMIDASLFDVRPPKVLVVDDCHLTQHVICTLLKQLTDDVSQAFDGSQAIDMCQAKAFDIIYMDIHLPNVSGVQATQQIRTSVLNAYTPIIAFTSRGTTSDYVKLGFNDLLQKPFTVPALKEQFELWTTFRAPATPTTTAPLASASASIQRSPLASATQMQFPGVSGFPGLDSSKGLSSPSGVQQPQQAALMSLFQNPMQANGVQPPQTVTSGMAPQPKRAAQVLPTSTFPAPTEDKRTWLQKKKPKNSLGHTEKEKKRRADIVDSCNRFRQIVPSIKDADKAKAFRTSVEYMKFLQSKFSAEDLAKFDQEFEQLIGEKDGDGTKPAGQGE
eukprot:m.143905 g.143905  ORF g.143905 m.143905 type:complete len:500 (+) comp14109_c0_seq1:419-1918(+)